MTGSLDTTFTAALEKDGAFATYLTVPDSAALLGTRRPVKVSGTLDGEPFAATLMPSGPAHTGSPSEPRSASSSARAGGRAGHRPPSAALS